MGRENTTAFCSCWAEGFLSYRREAGGQYGSPLSSTLPATEQWVKELLPDFSGVAITPEDET